MLVYMDFNGIAIRRRSFTRIKPRSDTRNCWWYQREGERQWTTADLSTIKVGDELFPSSFPAMKHGWMLVCPD